MNEPAVRVDFPNRATGAFCRGSRDGGSARTLRLHAMLGCARRRGPGDGASERTRYRYAMLR
jgi:hypothetical protein